MKTKILTSLFVSVLLFIAGTLPASAHCDSYDGPTVKDAITALETKNVKLILKWITPEREGEIIKLFNKTYSLRSGDKEIYAIVEKHFLETLVRLHRESEGAPFTGLKAAGTTKPIINMSDQAIADRNIDSFITKFSNHLGKVIREKYAKVEMLDKVKDESPEQGRAFVAAYVDYTHTIEAIHDIIAPEGGSAAHKH